MPFLNTLDPLVLGLIILSVAVLILAGMVVWMHLKLQKFLIGVKSDHIGDTLTFVSRNLEDLQKFRSELEKYLSYVERRLRKSVQSVHTIRFNPFKGVGGGGNQSFSTAFLNEEGDGVIISSIYSREHLSVYSKPLNKYESEFKLSDEEHQSLEEAKRKLK